jgi:hypothetical protein
LTFKGKPRLCNQGCNTIIVWYHDDATGEEFFVEVDGNGQLVQRHRCPNWNPNSNNKTASPEKLQRNKQAQIVSGHVVEIQVIPLAEANKLLSIKGAGEYELVGSDPIKVLHDQFFVVIGRKSFDSNYGV